MKYAPYSVSKIECFVDCPKKFEWRYITKPKIVSSFKHLEKGKLWHCLIEHAIKRTTKNFKKPFLKELTEQEYLKELDGCIKFIKSDFFLPYLNDIMNFKQLTEQEFFLDKLGKVSLNKINDPLMKGYIDLFQYDDFHSQVIDWKTGGKSVENIENFPKTPFQLEVYAYVAYTLLNSTSVTAKYVYVEHEYEKVYTNFNPRETWREIQWLIDCIEKTSVFERKESGLCGWCDYASMCL